MKRFIFLCVAVACSTIVNNQLWAQSDTAINPVFKGMAWRNIGPTRGGRSLGSSGSPGRKQEYYFGAVGGGLWKTTDGGQSWNPVTDGQLTSSSVGAVAVAETNPDIVYIGTGETQLRGNIMQGDGVYKTTNAGKTWTNIGLKNTQAIARVRIHPTNPDIVYVAALGHPYGPNEERGIFRTTDGGKTWKKILYKGDKAGGVDIIIDRKNPNVLYASIWQVYRTPWKMWGGGGASGLFKSTDGGDTWTELTRKPGMPKGTVGKIGVTVSPVDNNRVWAIVEAEDGGVYRSDDAGMTWKHVNDERKLRQRAFYYSRIYADPLDKNGVYCLNVGFYKSSDGGVKFNKTITVPHGDNHDLWIDPADSTRMITSNDGGGAVSVNGGKTWTDENFPTAQLYHITATNDFPYHIAGAQQDNTTVAVASEGWTNQLVKNNSIKKGEWGYEVGGGESGYIAQDPKNPDIFYAGSQGALLTRYDRSTGQTRDVQIYPRFFSGEPASALPERWQWTYPIVFSPKDPNRLYACSQHVWVSTNEGQSWEKISPDLTYADTTTLGKSGGVITMDMNGPEIYATVFALAPSYHDVNTIWAGSDDGLIHITRDHGKSWQKITPPDMPKNTRVSLIEASRHKPGTAYVAAKRYQMDDRAPYLWKTDDYGKTWKKIITGLHATDFAHSIREDITRPGLLYAGMEHGIWVSFNDGDTWQPLQLKLPDTQISDIQVTEKDVVIGTHGRSIYVLDDISPIREFTPDLTKKPVHLFKPYYAVRRVQPAVFQYYLAKQADSVKVDILDAAGTVIQSFTGTKPTNPKTGGDDDDDDEPGKPKVKLPTTAAGLNRYEWDLRYPGATYFKGMILWGARPTSGPLALPGQYQVRLTVGTQSFTQPFEIRLDPRLKGVTVADVQEQFKMAMKLRDETSKANDAVIQIRTLKEKLSKQPENPTNQKLKEQLGVIEENLYQIRNQSGQDPLNFPIKLNNRLAALWRSIESGDSRPTDGSYKVYEELSGDLTKQLSDLDKLIKSSRIGM
ncbi:hypothetical protein GCM10028818_60350 [Spirosoma horti]